MGVFNKEILKSFFLVMLFCFIICEPALASFDVGSAVGTSKASNPFQNVKEVKGFQSGVLWVIAAIQWLVFWMCIGFALWGFNKIRGNFDFDIIKGIAISLLAAVVVVQFESWFNAVSDKKISLPSLF